MFINFFNSININNFNNQGLGMDNLMFSKDYIFLMFFHNLFALVYRLAYN